MPGKPISKSKQKGLAKLAQKKPELAKKFGYNPNRMDREALKKAAMEAEKVKIKDEKDMSNVQGAKDGGRMGYRKGGGICKKGLNKKAIGRNS